MKLLILTDHRSHKPTDSIYEMANQLSNYFEIWIGSRGYKINDSFFDLGCLTNLHAKRWDIHFLYKNSTTWYNNLKNIHFDDISCVLLRIDSPLKIEPLIKLNKVYPNLIINDPIGISISKQRKYLLDFPECTINSAFINNFDELVNFTEQKPAVIKLEDSFGGVGVHRVDSNIDWNSEESLIIKLKEKINNNILSHKGVFIQEYTKNISKGDKRIIVAFGTVLGSILRLPAEGEWRCNLSQGGAVINSEADAKELLDISIIDKKLNEIGVYFYGVDTLVDNNGIRVISELNVINVGGLIQINSDDFSAIKKFAKLLHKHFIHLT